jgi:hypothetical protein
VQHQQYLELFSFVKNKLLSFQTVHQTEPLHSLFHLPISEEAFAQLEQLQQLLNNQVISDNLDWWQYIWGNNQFSSKKAYLHLTGHAQVPQVFEWLWKSSCQNKHKVFSSYYSKIASALETYSDEKQ